MSIRVDSEYPFLHSANITVCAEAPASFELAIRIPAWAKDVRLNGKKVRVTNGHIRLARVWQGETALSLTMTDAPRMVRRPGDLRAVVYGPLVFSLPISAQYRMKEYTDQDVERRFPYCDYELIPQSDWNYGFAAKALRVVHRPIGEIPFSSTEPPLEISCTMAQVPWDWADGYDSVPSAVPASRKAISAGREMTLIPYGCAKLRMTEMPLIR